MKLFFKILKFSYLFFIPLFVVIVFFKLEDNGFFNASEIIISVRVLPEQKSFSKPYIDKLNEQLKIYKGQSLRLVSLKKISENLKNQKWIKNFRLSKSWPSAISIEIEPYVISLLYSDQLKIFQGKVIPVTNQGDLLEEVETSQAPPLALLTGKIFYKSLDKRKKAIDLLKSLPESGKLSHKLISEIGFNSKEGYWLEVAKNQTMIKMGLDQFAVKSSRVSQVLDYLEKRDLKARVIDANLSKKVLVRLQQSP